LREIKASATRHAGVRWPIGSRAHAERPNDMPRAAMGV
jgi:hypothetical protein